MKLQFQSITPNNPDSIFDVISVVYIKNDKEALEKLLDGTDLRFVSQTESGTKFALYITMSYISNQDNQRKTKTIWTPKRNMI